MAPASPAGGLPCPITSSYTSLLLSPGAWASFLILFRKLFRQQESISKVSLNSQLIPWVIEISEISKINPCCAYYGGV